MREEKNKIKEKTKEGIFPEDKDWSSVKCAERSRRLKRCCILFSHEENQGDISAFQLCREKSYC